MSSDLLQLLVQIALASLWMLLHAVNVRLAWRIVAANAATRWQKAGRCLAATVLAPWLTLRAGNRWAPLLWFACSVAYLAVRWRV